MIRRDKHQLTATYLKSLSANELEKLLIEIQDCQNAEERLHSVVESFPFGVALADGKGKIVLVNALMERLFGCPREDLIGLSSEMLLPPRLRATHIQLRNEFYSHPQPRPLGEGRELFAMRKDGSEIPVEISVCPIETGESRMFLAVIVDISERKRMEAELNRTRDAAIDTARLKSEFMANMSHEIRTPMNTILGMAALLTDGDLSPAQLKFAELIEQSGKTLLHIINDVLDFSKMESGRFSIEPAEMSVRRAVEDVVHMLAPAAEAKDLNLQYFIASDIPHLLRGDAARIGQVLTNLVGNALKFTKRGEVTIRVILEAQTESTDTVRITVQDTGLGISAEELRRLFQPFSQVGGSAVRKLGGTGLGLAISKKIVELMGGTIGVRSEPGRGSSFWFTVPLGREVEGNFRAGAPVTGVQTPHEPRIILPAAGIASSKKLRVLLAEDNPANQILTFNQLERLGHYVDIAQDGRQALEALSQASYDLVLMDCQMPEMDGYQATGVIRRREGPDKHTTIIAMTANVLEGEEAKCMAAGMDGYLPKPVTLAALKKLLGKCSGHVVGSGYEAGLSAAALPKAGEPVNMRVLMESTDNAPGMLRHLVRTYFEHTASRLKELERAVQEEIAVDVQNIAHTLAASSDSFGAELLIPTFRELERIGKDRRLAKAPSLMIKALEDLERVRRFLAASALLESDPAERNL